MPFLSIVTRTYKRPLALARCTQLLDAQTDQDFEHLVIEDTEGLGVAESHRLIRDSRPGGEYAMILDDDDFAATPYLVSDLKAAARAYSPDVIVFRANNAQLGIMPSRFVWQQYPLKGHIGGNNIAAKRQVWDACIPAIMTDGAGGGPVYEGDFYYLDAVWHYTTKLHWLDKVLIIVPYIGRGGTEAA